MAEPGAGYDSLDTVEDDLRNTLEGLDHDDHSAASEALQSLSEELQSMMDDVRDELTELKQTRDAVDEFTSYGHLEDQAMTMENVAAVFYEKGWPMTAEMAELCASEYQRLYEDAPGTDEPKLEDLDGTAETLLHIYRWIDDGTLPPTAS